MTNEPDIESFRKPVAQQWRELREDARHLADHPCVPDNATLRAAWAELRRTGFRDAQPEGSDALWLGAVLEIHVYRAFIRAKAATVPTSLLENRQDVIAILGTLANYGSSDFTIGMAVDRGTPGQEVRVSDFTFDSAPRRPDWMGLCPSWPLVKDRFIEIYMAPLSPEHPAAIVAHREPPGGTPGEKETPEGVHAANLARVLDWHGAKEVQWHYALGLRYVDDQESRPNVDLRDRRPGASGRSDTR